MRQILLLACTIMVHLSVLQGLGQDQAAIWADSHDRLTKALLYLIIAQIFGVSTMGVAKISLGLFLLRLTTVPWHRWTIWTAIVLLFLVTGVTSFVFAFQCSPPAYLWDKTIEGGTCPIVITPFAITLGVACVVADVFFALFPWLFLWKLNRAFKERAIIAGAMSLGLVAAACGIKRTIGLGALESDNYTTEAVPTCGWSIAELALTLICIAIPVCLPLWKAISSATSSKRSSRKTTSGGADGGAFAMRTFGGGTMHSGGGNKGAVRSREMAYSDSITDLRRSLSQNMNNAESSPDPSRRPSTFSCSDGKCNDVEADIEKTPRSHLDHQDAP
jgi:uncharacterized membrane protein YgcG